MPTPVNPLDKYTAIAADTKIQFLSGLQSAINTMIASGGAVEGAFYLTIDTHKLYVGRKNSTDNKIYPEQVSRGVTVVGTSSELPTPTVDAPAGAIEEGELFYITDSNVLAALRLKRDISGVPVTPTTYEWVQINPPTGITAVITSATNSDVSDPDNNTVTVNTQVQTAGGNQTGAFDLVAGDNVSLVGSVSGTKGIVTINATDSTYTQAVGTNSSKGIIGLKKGSASTLDSSVDIEGSGTVAVTSDGNKITVAGPTINSVTAQNHVSAGFVVDIDGTDGAGNALNVNAATIDPIIKYGQAGTTLTTGVHFASGAATLDIYTKDETDTAINNAITSRLETANAMTYKGIVTSPSDLQAKVTQNGGAHNGDVYKVGIIESGTTFDIGGVPVDTGDLIIITETYKEVASPTGNPTTLGYYVKSGNTYVLTDDTSVVPGTTYYKKYSENSSGVIPFSNQSELLDFCELIPSGDEPEVKGDIYANTTGTGTPVNRISLQDGKDANSNILTANFISGNKIKVIGASTVGTGKTLSLTFNHETTARNDATVGDKSDLSLVTTTGNDTIGQSKVKLFVLNGYNGLQTDSYGHVTGLQGKEIVFEHNSIASHTTSYGVNTASGQISIATLDKIGNTSTASFKLNSDTLKLTGDDTNKQLKVDLVWGTFS